MTKIIPITSTEGYKKSLLPKWSDVKGQVLSKEWTDYLSKLTPDEVDSLIDLENSDLMRVLRRLLVIIGEREIDSLLNRVGDSKLDVGKVGSEDLAEYGVRQVKFITRLNTIRYLIHLVEFVKDKKKE